MTNEKFVESARAAWKVLTIKQMADVAGVSLFAVHYWLQDRNLPYPVLRDGIVRAWVLAAREQAGKDKTVAESAVTNIEIALDVKEEEKPKIYVDVILRDGHGNFLCQHHPDRPNKPWRFPGGKPEEGETLIAAAAREAKEELGIEVLSLRFFGKKSAVSDGGEVWTGYVFVCDLYFGEPRVVENSKHDELRYLTVEEIKALGAEPEYSFARALALGQTHVLSVKEL